MAGGNLVSGNLVAWFGNPVVWSVDACEVETVVALLQLPFLAT